MPSRSAACLLALALTAGVAAAGAAPMSRADAWRLRIYHPEVFLPRLRAAAEAGDVTAQVTLGEVLVWPEVLRADAGSVVPRGQDPDALYPAPAPDEGVGWIRKAHDQGDPYATRLLVMAHIEGRGVEQDFDRAGALIEALRPKHPGYADLARAELGIRRDDPKAEIHEFARRAAREGMSLARMFWGIGGFASGPAGDAARRAAIQADEAACKAGDLRACQRWGEALEYGEGVPRDAKAAFHAYRQTGTPVPLERMQLSKLPQGAEVQVALANLFRAARLSYVEMGADGDRNASKGWTYAVAEKGYLPARVRMGWLEEQDPDRLHFAMQHYADAFAQGDLWSRSRLAALRRFDVLLGITPRSMREEVLRKQAEGGDPEALIALAIHLSHAEASKEDAAEGFALLEAAAAKGSGRAHFLVGDRYVAGLGVEEDRRKAVTHLEKAVELGFHTAGALLGHVLRQGGPGFPRDFDRAFQVYSACSEEGVTDCTIHLGHAYRIGWGTEPDPEKATELYKQAADKGSADGRYAKAVNLLYTSKDRVMTNHAQTLLRMDANRGHPASKLFWTSLVEHTPEKLGKPMSYIHAHRGILAALPKSYFDMANLYAWGKLGPVDQATAAKIYKGGADLGHAPSMRYLAGLVFTGTGVEKDEARGRELFQEAAERGSVGAASLLGEIYSNPKYGVVDLEEARRWYQKAAEAGGPQEWKGLMGFYVTHDQPQALLDLIDGCQGEHCTSAEVLDARIYGLIELRRFPEARAAVADFRQRFPDNPRSAVYQEAIEVKDRETPTDAPTSEGAEPVTTGP